MQLINQLKDFLHLLHVFRRAHPELALGPFEALGLDLFDLHDGIVALLAPLQLLIEEVEHGEVETPHVVAARQVNVVVGVERGERDRPAEVCVLPLGHRLARGVKVLLGEAEVHDEDLSVFPVEHKIAGFDVTVDKAAFVNLFDGNDHLDEDLDRYFEVVACLEAAAGLGQVDAEQVHDDEILLAVLHVFVRIWHVLQA